MATLILVVYAFFLAAILLYNLLQLNLLFHYLRRGKIVPPPPLDPASLPLVTIQLPLYNEPYVAERLIDNILALDYPRDRFEVQVLDDSTDGTTALCERKAAHYRAQGFDIQVIHRTDRWGYKAGALADGLPRAKGEFIAVFDADFLPNPQFLRRTLGYFQHPKVGVVQTRWTHLNEDYSLFAKLQALQLNVHFTIEQMGRRAGHHFLQFNGTAGIWRKSAIADAGGWRADTLTEDLDLSYRAQMRGWEIVYLEDVEAPAELPVEMNGIKSQQFRWMKGGAENARLLTPLVLKADIPLSTRLHAMAHLLNSSVFLAVLMIALTSVALVPVMDRYGAYTGFLSLSLLGLVGVATVYFVANLRLLPRPRTLRQVLALIFYFPLLLTLSMGLSFHNSVAVIEGLLGIKSSFVRTPKFNIVGQQRGKTDRRQRNPIGKSLIIEGLLTLLFASALVIAVSLQSYGFFIFHLMLAIGFGAIFVASWRER
ncbi:MAG: glycosyltransferase [Gammaproteobacteria bacterium]|nr:glycosyltransferase [Candidatus Thioaporhodococcus sediminis]TNF53982.1 MAG: glycosyltransferase [Gammaproteobacteria bacterium]